MRPPSGPVLRDLPPDQRVAEVDWSRWYLDEDEMVESFEQGAIIRIMLSSLSELARQRGWARILFGADNYFAWVPEEPRVRVSPDIYLVDDPPEPPIPSGWQTWQEGHRPPRWAVEIVSSDWKKDYLEGPEKYAQLGCRELILFDPDVARLAMRNPLREALTVYRKGADGLFVRVYSGAGPCYSAEIDAWLHVRIEGPVARLRIALDEQGKSLVPTEGERAQAEAERAEAQAGRADEEARKRAEAERRVRELEERLRNLEKTRG
jgi:Uma2 family endonuclease